MGEVIRARQFLVWLCIAALLAAACMPDLAPVAALDFAVLAVTLTAVLWRRSDLSLHPARCRQGFLFAPRAPPLP